MTGIIFMDARESTTSRQFPLDLQSESGSRPIHRNFSGLIILLIISIILFHVGGVLSQLDKYGESSCALNTAEIFGALSTEFQSRKLRTSSLGFDEFLNRFYALLHTRDTEVNQPVENGGAQGCARCANGQSG